MAEKKRSPVCRFRLSERISLFISYPISPTGVLRRGRPRQQLLTSRSLFILAAIALLFLSVVIPNSLQVPTAIALVVCFLSALPGFKISSGVRTVLLFYACSAIVTLIYIAVGLLHGAPLVSAVQVLIIYVASPFLWIVVATCLYTTVGEVRLIGWFVWLSLLCCISVAIYFSLYETGGAAAVSFFVKTGNVNLHNGYAGAIMYVYGSLIFLCGAFFSSPELIRSKLLRVLLLASLFVCAITSGRSALILSMPIGLLLGLLLTPHTTGYAGRTSFPMNVLRIGLPVALAAGVAVYAVSRFSSIQLAVVFDSFINKLAAGGGAHRTGQVRALFNGILDSNGIGVGHGIGVSYISSSEYPWRYELVWVATILRVGIVGACVYASVFFYYIARVARVAARRRLTVGSKFMFCGFIAAFVASNTNPYIEAFIFQWMYVMPIVGFFLEYSSSRPAASGPKMGWIVFDSPRGDKAGPT